MSLITKNLGKDGSSLISKGLGILEQIEEIILSSAAGLYNIILYVKSSLRVFSTSLGIKSLFSYIKYSIKEASLKIGINSVFEYSYTSKARIGGFYRLPWKYNIVKLEEKEYALRYSIPILSKENQLKRIGIVVLKPQKVKIHSDISILINVIKKYPISVALLEIMAGHVKFNSLPLIIGEDFEFEQNPSLFVHNVVFSRNE